MIGSYGLEIGVSGLLCAVGISRRDGYWIDLKCGRTGVVVELDVFAEMEGH
jgi:hypothetical protein